jgi:hypothetical protein
MDGMEVGFTSGGFGSRSSAAVVSNWYEPPTGKGSCGQRHDPS